MKRFFPIILLLLTSFLAACGGAASPTPENIPSNDVSPSEESPMDSISTAAALPEFSVEAFLVDEIPDGQMAMRLFNGVQPTVIESLSTQLLFDIEILTADIYANAEEGQELTVELFLRLDKQIESGNYALVVCESANLDAHPCLDFDASNANERYSLPEIGTVGRLEIVSNDGLYLSGIGYFFATYEDISAGTSTTGQVSFTFSRLLLPD